MDSRKQKKEPIDAGEVYRGPCGVLKDTNWLTAEALPTDRDTIVQIESVIIRRNAKLRDETKKVFGSLRFVGKEKELGLNVTNMRRLAALYGPNTGDWFGKWIALYVDPDVSAFGQIVSAVRIRAKKVDAPAKGAASDAPPTEEEMRRSDALFGDGQS